MRIRVPLSLALLLTLSILGFTAALTPPVHAAGIAFKAKASNPNGFSPMTVGPLTIALGDALVVNVMWFGTGPAGTVTDSQGNRFTLTVQSISAQSSGASTGIFGAIASSSGSDTVTVTRSSNAFTAAFLDYSGVASFGQTSTQQLDSAGSSGSSIVSLSNVAGTSSWIVESFFYETSGASGSVTANNSQNLRDSMSTVECATNGFGNCNTYDTPAPASGFSLSLSYSSNSCTGSGCFASHSALELLAGTPSNIQIVDRCFGNCGAPAVTVLNTNSTHGVNFNQSITVFYIAQSSLNGFVENVTAQVAKTYTNGETIAIGLYTVDPVCTASSNPFTPQCPGFLVQKQGLTANPNRGAFSMASTVAVQNGQWFGVAVTGGFQGLDLNDTNTNVILDQAAGQIPTVISQYTGLGASKLALYGFVRGNSIIIGPGSGQVGAGCQTVTCGILALWGVLGGDVAAGIGAFLITLGLIVGFLLYISRQHNPDGTIKGFAVPVELLGIVAVVVLIMFSVAGAIPAWIPGVIIFLVAGLFVVGIWGHRRHANTVQG